MTMNDASADFIRYTQQRVMWCLCIVSGLRYSIATGWSVGKVIVCTADRAEVESIIMESIVSSDKHGPCTYKVICMLVARGTSTT